MDFDHLVGNRQRAVTAAIRAAPGRQIDDDRARLHRLDGVFTDERWRGAPRNQRGGDHDVRLRETGVHQLRLTREPRGGHRTRIAAHAFGDLAFFVGFKGNVDELGAERFDLLAHGRTHVRCFDHRAQTLGRGNGLQARNARAQHNQPGGLDRAGGRHEHGHEALIEIGGEHHGLVAGDVGLRGQYVHALRTRGPRRGFQSEADDAGRRHAGVILGVERVEHADDRAAARDLRQFVRRRRPHLEYEFRTQRVGGAAQRGASGLEGGVGNTGGVSCTASDNDLMSRRDQLFHRLGRGRDTGFTGKRLGGDADSHCVSPWVCELISSEAMNRGPRSRNTHAAGAGALPVSPLMTLVLHKPLHTNYCTNR
ncbi:hypothetical protein PHO31112_04556 [Pandoraea horticolens]|uniref:Uncharacterized protein n=1 Tax=Pandoraea horticolens TaxID=2508298 RepID=A0A5E4YIN8_9BURK|nr:hypothetical protein PHO31112_04556 [Pandoraea horticolens]